MKKCLMIVAAMLLLGMLFAESNSGKIVSPGKFDAYLQMASVTQATDRALKEFVVIGPKEIGAVYGLDRDWAIGGSMQFAVDTLGVAGAPDKYYTFSGPITVFGQRNLGQVDLPLVNNVDLKAVIAYDLTPARIDIDKKLIGGDGATEKKTALTVAIKGSKEIANKITAGASLYLVNIKYDDDPDNNLELDYKSSNAFGYSLGADYLFADNLTGYITLTHTFDSSAVRQGTGLLKDDSGSIVFGGQMKF